MDMYGYTEGQVYERDDDSSFELVHQNDNETSLIYVRVEECEKEHDDREYYTYVLYSEIIKKRSVVSVII